MGQFDISANPENKNPIIPSNVSERGPGTSASEDQGQVRPQSHKINTSLVLLQVLIRVRAMFTVMVRVRDRVRVRVTKLVYQIGFTTPF